MEIYKNLSLENLPNEEWRFIPNTDNLYMISNMGRVKSVDSYRVYENYTRNCKSRIRKQFPNWQGYLGCFVTNRKGDRIHIVTHKVVCDVFIPNTNNLPCVNHKDENKQNNKVDNLEHCTYAYNLTYGSRAEEKDVAVIQYDLEGNFIKEHKSVRFAAKDTNTNPRSISNVIHGWAKQAGGYIWRLKEGNSLGEVQSYVNYNKSAILCYNMNGDFIREYKSMIDAEKDLNICYQSISDCCRGKRKSVKGFIFKYKYKK